MAGERTTTAMSITLPNNVKALTDMVLTPPGFIDVPKGSYSQLLGTLLTAYLENTFEADIHMIYDIFSNNPDISTESLKREIHVRKTRNASLSA